MEEVNELFYSLIRESENLLANLEMDSQVLNVLKGLHCAPHESCTHRQN